MADSWEDEMDAPPPRLGPNAGYGRQHPQAPGLNPNASFYNPGAPAFQPQGYHGQQAGAYGGYQQQAHYQAQQGYGQPGYGQGYYQGHPQQQQGYYQAPGLHPQGGMYQAPRGQPRPPGGIRPQSFPEPDRARPQPPRAAPGGPAAPAPAAAAAPPSAAEFEALRNMSAGGAPKAAATQPPAAAAAPSASEFAALKSMSAGAGAAPAEAAPSSSAPAAKAAPGAKAEAAGRDQEQGGGAQPSPSKPAEEAATRGVQDLKLAEPPGEAPGGRPNGRAPSRPASADNLSRVEAAEEAQGAGAAAKAVEEEGPVEDAEKRRAAVQKELDALNAEDSREHLNIVFIGHVDAGKSTTGGQILYLTGGVDERTIEKYEREAKDKNRESWYMAYIMDTNEEERAKGKTVEVGRANFMTTKKRYTILDAPGHKNYVPNMIAGAALADVGVLVVSARKGEFEAGFERGGQTREHSQLAKTLGVAKLVVAINKMDDPGIVEDGGKWSKGRYDEIVDKLGPFLRSTGYNLKKDVVFLPMSGLLGHNLRDAIPSGACPWYKGPTLFSVLDEVETPARDPFAPFRMSVIDKFKDMGTIAMGKSETGFVRKGDRLYVMPNKAPVTVSAIWRDEEEVRAARGGENLRIRLDGISEADLQAGFVLCPREVPVPCVTYFEAQLQILDLLEHKAIFTAGYKAVLHIHSVVEECEITRLLASLNPKTREKNKKVTFVKSGSLAIVLLQVEKPICVELFERVAQLGRFTLRDEGKTIAIGKVTKLPKSLKENAPEAK